MLTALIHLSLLAGVVGQATHFDQRALIEQALDEPTRITLDDVPLGQALAAITKQTGVPVVMSGATMSLVPNGSRTLVRKVEIANMTLRRALAELFGPLAMTFTITDRAVEIVPTPALQRLGRSPDWAELDSLVFLSNVQPGIDDAALAALKDRVQFSPAASVGWAELAGAIRRVGAGAGDEVLSAGCASLETAWSLAGDHIFVAPVQEHIRRQLGQPISIRKNFRPLFEVLQGVAAVSGVRIRVEPGALASLPVVMQRNFSLNVLRQPAEQVLDSIAAYTGLGYLIDQGGVLFYAVGGPAPFPYNPAEPPARTSNSLPLPTPSLRNPVDDPIVAKITVQTEDGRTVEWLIRASELPDDLRRMRERDLQELFEAMGRRAVPPRP